MQHDTVTFDFKEQSSTPDHSGLWFILLRWCSALAQGLFILAANYLLELELPITALFGLVGLVALSNALLHRQHFLQRALPPLEWILVADTLILTGILYLTGGAANPFSIIYLVHIILAAVVLGERWTWIMTALSVLLYGILFFPGSGHGTMHDHHGGFSMHLEGMWVAFAFTAMLIAFFVNRILLSLKQRDEEAVDLKLRVAKTEQFAALVNLAAGAAHELGTPLSTIAVAAKEIQYGLLNNRPVEEQQADTELITTEINRCKKILESLGGQSGELRGEMPTRFSLAELREDLQRFAVPLGIKPEALLPDTVADERELVLPREILLRSLSNLIRNSIDADPSLSVDVDAKINSDTVEFIVSDRGRGISADLLHRLGEPFLTTKPPGKGMGLGVFLIKVFAERLGGELSYRNRDPQGTIASLSLPIACS